MNIEPIIEAILFASGEPVPVGRFCAVLDADRQSFGRGERLADQYLFEQRGIADKAEDSLQLCSLLNIMDSIRKR